MTRAERHAYFAELGIIGGAVYDGLVAAAAEAHGLLLLSCDPSGLSTYQTLGVQFELVGAGPHR